jgi:trehalose 6-phosphate phosphatase
MATSRTALSYERLSDGLLADLAADPQQAAVLLDVDGTLAPIVERAQDATVPKETSLLLARLSRRYATLACISGRAATDVRRLVGVGGIEYSGLHGAELLEPNTNRAEILPEFARFMPEVRRFVARHDSAELRALRVRIEDKGPIVALHWRGAPDEAAALARVEELASEAEAAGLATHWGRKVLELRPPVPFDKGQAVRDLIEPARVRTAMFGGDDSTDLDAFDALEQLVEEGALDAGVRVGVRSDEGPPAIVERADVVVDGVEGFARVLAILAEP